MWHEARRQERKIRGMLVDYRKRAERRRDFYEKIKADPTQFLQIHGRQCKIHLDPAIAAAADSTAMMPWQGNENNFIDRFDVRAHLDYIPPLKKEDDYELTQEDRQLNYERYRIIAQNAYLGISEEKFLKQLHLEEQFGYTETKSKKEPKATGVAIGFNYEEGTAIAGPTAADSSEDNFDDENSDSDLDVDLAINVSKVDSAQAHEMNKHGQHFGMAGNDFYSFLTDDLEEAETYKLAKEEEHEKALYAGRKSRRERRAHREKRLANRKISPPSYAAKESPTNISLRDESKSPSRSPSPDAGKITYITSFGGEEDPPSTSKPSYADKVKYGKPKRRRSSGSDRLVYFKRSSSREVSYDRVRSYNGRSRSRSRSRRERRDRTKSRSPRKRTFSRSRSRSLRTSRHSKSRSLSPRRIRKRTRSSSSSRSRSRSRSKRSRTRSSRSPSPQRAYRHRSSSSSPLSSDENPPGVSKSRSISPVPAKSKSKSKSKSPVAPAPPRIRYYGRKKSDVSSSESSSSSSDENDDYNNKPGPSESGNRFGNNSGNMSKKSTSGLTVIERLKLKRQALINRQFKKDKIAEVQKIMREKEAQQTREDELREMAIKLRRRQRELRHAYDRSSSSGSDRSDVSKKTRERSSSPTRLKESERDRQRSVSRERNRRESRRDRSQDRGRIRRRSPSHSRRYDRSRDRDGRRSRSSTERGSFKKLVDY